VGLLLGTPVYSDEAQDLDGQVERIDKTAKGKKVTQAELETVSRATKVPVPELKRQQSKTGMGAGSLMIANSLAAKTGQSFDDIMAARSSGRGWGQIAKDNNVKLGPLMKQAKQVSHVQKQNASRAKKTSRVESDDRSAGRKGNAQGDKRDNRATAKNLEVAGGKPSKGGGKAKK